MIANYKNLYFQVNDITRVQGERTCPKLLLLLNQINANELYVQRSLGGGIHGHIGLVLSQEDY